jgi:pyruvate carboxylase
MPTLAQLMAKSGDKIRDVDVISHAMYPDVFESNFDGFMKFKDQYASMDARRWS